ncbi:CHAT domain-containing protein [Actinomadura sp. DC4]|uniref:CHAT domain-containing protein n=1 Tax=Actinomadura sp. DC4 TaxID=3055069 RepID=UPI0025B02D5F|nr:CHAT domain-containing protein [Actinomadura sp. DC4]MDN3353857.1 CHAT domain-containing protein [Actinomadura sp. DC4]
MTTDDEPGRPDPDLVKRAAEARDALARATSPDEVIEVRHGLVWVLLDIHRLSRDGRVTPELSEAVGHADRLVAETADHWAAALALYAAAHAYAALGEVTGRAAPRDTAIELLSRALRDVIGSDRVEALFLLAKLSLERWSDAACADDPADLDTALERASQAWELAEAFPESSGPLMTKVRAVLGLAFCERFAVAEPDTREERQAVDEAIVHLSAVAEALPDGPYLDELRVRLARAHWARLHLEEDGTPARAADRDAVIELLRGFDDVWARFIRGLALEQRHTATGSPEDRDEAIAALLCVLDLEDDDTDERSPTVLSALLDGGALLLGRAEDDGDRPADLDAAIACFGRALPLLPPEDPERVPALMGLAHAHVLRGGEHPGEERLNTIISCYSEAWPQVRADTGLDRELRLTVVAELGIARVERMRTAGAHPGDHDAAIDELTETRGLMATDGGASDAWCAALLGICHAARAQEGIGGRTNVSADLARATELLTEALDRLPADDPIREETTAALAATTLVGVNMHIYGPARLTDLTVILRDALVSPPSDAAVRCWLHQALGVALYWQTEPDIDAGIVQLEEAARLAPAPPELVTTTFNLANALVQRFFLRGDLADVDAAIRQMDELEASDALLARVLPAADRLGWRALRTTTRLLQGVSRGGTEHYEPAVEELRAVIDRLPADHPQRGRWLGDLGMAIMVAAQARGDLPAAREALPLLDEAARSLDGPMKEICLIRSAALRAVTAQAPVRRDLDVAIATLTGLTGSPTVGPRAGVMAGVLLLERYRLGGAPADVDQAIARLRDAPRRLAPGHPLQAEMARRLAEAYRAAGDAPRSATAGEAALRAWGHNVLLQSGAARAVAAGRSGNGFARTVACWRLADGSPQAAVRVLELGRGLVLHAATAGTRIADELRAAGHGDLFAEWDRAKTVEREPAGTVAAVMEGLMGPQVPGDLRRRVLDALATTPRGLRLTGPPDVSDIAGAVRRTGADALCYLLPRHELPGGSTAPGRALLVTADGGVEDLALPELATGPGGAVAEYAEALAGIADPPGSPAGRRQRRRWREALDVVCDWAWPAAIGPLLDRFPSLPRLVLVPMGRLGVVPWHAARTPDGDYAVEKAVLSYAASGRQLVDAAHRPHLDGDAVIVSDPTGELTWANAEARALRRHYPDARRLARPTATPGVGIADPETVLAALPSADAPGASLLHLSCHGHGLGSPADSHLRLIHVVDGTVAEAPLTVERILHRANGRPPAAPGGLVMLSACFSDLTVTDHDEALTLASAFLAAGAATVVGTRWQITERAATLLSVVFHHHLAHGLTPPDALRAAQLWMLDRRREPPDLPPALAALTTTPGLDLTDPAGWAAFTHQGR